MATVEQRLDPVTGRNETPLERCDRNLVELLQEVRVVQTGVQVLFAFLLTAPLSARFPVLSPFQRLTFFATLLATGAAVVLLVMPTAYHRVLFRQGDKQHLVELANRATLVALFFVATAIVGALLLVTDLLFGPAVAAVTTVVATAAIVWLWCAAPFRRRAQLGPRLAGSGPE